MDKNVKDMSPEEFDKYIKQKELENTASVEDFINYLKTHYKPTDKLCWIDCVEGYKYECVYIKKNELGKNRFVTIKQDKERILKKDPNVDIFDWYPYVDDNDILIN